MRGKSPAKPSLSSCCGDFCHILTPQLFKLVLTASSVKYSLNFSRKPPLSTKPASPFTMSNRLQLGYLKINYKLGGIFKQKIEPKNLIKINPLMEKFLSNTKHIDFFWQPNFSVLEHFLFFFSIINLIIDNYIITCSVCRDFGPPWCRACWRC